MALDAPAGPARALLTPDERARAERYHRAIDRDRFTVLRAAVRGCLGAALGVPGADLTLVLGEFGKPALGGAHAQAGLAFNASRSAGVGLIALSTAGPVGVDVERVRALPELADMAARIMAPREHAAWCALPAAEQVAAFYVVWSRKEALIKGIGVGLGAALRELEVGIDPTAAAVTERGAPSAWRLHAVPIDDGFAACVAVT